MPTYEFSCQSCGHEHELVQSITLPLPERCPACGSVAYGQVYTGGMFCSCKQDPTTVGQQAEINERREGRTRMQELVGRKKEVREQKAKARAEKLRKTGGTPIPLSGEDGIPFWRAGLPDESKPLNLNRVKDTKKYIETGKLT